MVFTMLTPVLLLVLWTLIMLVWMAYQRVPKLFAQARAGNMPSRRTQELTGLPPQTVWAADNYNHLHEQPTLFYALCVYSHLVGVADSINIGLALSYVGLRVVHSVIQCTKNNALMRFRVFALASVVLLVIALRNLLVLFIG
ncbi:MAPEG family protein [Hirschia litorea]|uniref:MAPEG family protein n=1 Tax=Hirschia litorea TaxID=1199156 RepID=A0ABW2IKB1_9PROT